MIMNNINKMGKNYKEFKKRTKMGLFMMEKS